MNNQFKIGVGREVITPPLGTLLSGYPDKRPASEVCDDLCANVVAFSQGDTSGMMISIDICTIKLDLVNKIRAGINCQTGVLPQNISISAIHTHSGPMVNITSSPEFVDMNYINEVFIPNIIKAAKSAFDSMTPAVMGIGTTESTVGINREQLFLDGNVGLGQNPDGVYDPTMTLLNFKSTDGEPIVNLVHYGCHSTAAGDGTEITRDWPGVMVDRMEEQSGAITVFFNGAEGDVGPRLSNGKTIGDMSHVREIGSLAAIDAVRAYRTIKEYRTVEFSAVSDVVTLLYKPLLSIEEAEAELKELGDYDKLKYGIERRRHDNLNEIIRIRKSGEEIQTGFKFDQTLFSFNSVVFVPFPCEMFSYMAIRLRRHSSFQHTLCTCITNDYQDYILSRDQLSYMSYSAYIFIHGTGKGYTLVENTDDILVNDNLRIMKKFSNK